MNSARIRVSRSRAAAWLAPAALFLAGCASPPARPTPPPARLGDVSVLEFAKSAGLRVLSSNAAIAELRGDGIRVLVVGDPDGRVYVNGKSVERRGGIVARRGVLFLPADAAAQARQALKHPEPERAVRIAGTVVLDAGHGGKDPGAQVPGRAAEKSLNLSVALSAARYLRQKGATVLLTRSSDAFVELTDRCAVSNRAGARAFVSIHADFSKTASIQGHSILLPQRGSAQDARLARLISQSMATVGSVVHGVRLDDRGLTVLRNTTAPAVLVETGFLSNPADAAFLSDPLNQDRLGWAIAEGVGQFLQASAP